MIRYLLSLCCLIGCSSQPIYGLLGNEQGLIAVGWLGNIWSSSDGGANWTYQENPTEESINAITKDTDGTLYAAADKGIVLWQKPGQSWEYAPTPNIRAFLNGAFADERGVFFVGESGTILFSNDHGLTWRTTTAGKTWLRGIDGDSLGLYAVGFQGAFYCSFDAGKTWSEAKTGSKDSLYGVWADGTGGVYAVGLNGSILRVTERCTKAQAQKSNTAVTLFSVYGRSPDEIYAVGSRGVVLRTKDQGQIWEALPPKTMQELYSIAEVGAQLYAAGANRTTVLLE
jgi:photosystem II stability/assembly factor-like uncharacterized protein